MVDLASLLYERLARGPVHEPRQELQSRVALVAGATPLVLLSRRWRARFFFQTLRST